MAKPRVCFVATTKQSCEQVGLQLKNFLGKFIEVETWCLREDPTKRSDSDIFIIGSTSVCQQISEFLPKGKKVLIAKRTLEIDHLDELLALPPGTEALMLSSWEKTAHEKIELLHNFGINKLTLYPQWPANPVYPKHVRLAIRTGDQIVPPEIERVIDVGVRTLDLSTFVELIVELNLPRDTINEISEHYISAIIQIATRRLLAADQSEKLKRRLEAVLGTVDQGIIAIDKDAAIVLFNPMAEEMLNIKSELVLGKTAGAIIPEVGEYLANHSGSLYENIQKIGTNYYIINTTPITDLSNQASDVVISLKAANQVQELDSKVRRELKRKGNIAKHSFKDIITESETMRNVISMAKRFSHTDLTVLIEGPSGTGKELLSQSIHTASNRKNAPFVAVNFAALPDNLVESELFGYEEGAFTGARKGGKAGLFEEAHTGTIFLDEIGDISLEVQKKLLRVLEEREVRRVGGSVVTPVDVRIIAATNQNLLLMVEEGKFRQDLYFRLCTIQIEIPPLCERKKDIPILIGVFANKLYRRNLVLADDVLEYLVNYNWPGNVRELQNVVKFLCGITEGGQVITLRHLPAYLLKRPALSKLVHASKPASKEVEAVVAEFSRIGELETLKLLLKELKHASIFGRHVGRSYIIQSLANQSVSCPEHKARGWFKRLERGGCISTGVTKQGSRITCLGEEVLAFLDGNDDCFIKGGNLVNGYRDDK